MTGAAAATLPPIAALRRASTACPSQWHGRLADGRPLYIRFRHDELSVHLGPVDGKAEEAVAAPASFWFDLGGAKRDGLIELEDVLQAAGLRLSSELAADRKHL